MTQNISDPKNKFDEIYQNSYDIPSWSRYPISENVINFIKFLSSKGTLEKNSPILDAGCGRGRLLVELEKLSFTNTTGVDISNVAVEYARSQTHSSTVIVADLVNNLPFPNNSFDLIFDLTMVSSCHPDRWPNIFQEFNRLLKNGGYLISEIFERPFDTSLIHALAKKNEKIPSQLDQIYGITEEEINIVFGKYFKVIEYSKSYPDSIGRYFILAKKQ